MLTGVDWRQTRESCNGLEGDGTTQGTWGKLQENAEATELVFADVLEGVKNCTMGQRPGFRLSPLFKHNPALLATVGRNP